MIIWNADDPWGPGKDDKCIMCRGRLHPPLVVWHPSYRGEDEEGACDYGKFICNACCLGMGRGLWLDMQRIETAKKVGRLGFRQATKRAAEGGKVLCETNTTTKQ